MQTIILKGTIPGNRVTIVRKKEIESYLLGKGFSSENDNEKGITFFVEDSYEVFKELYKKGFL